MPFLQIIIYFFLFVITNFAISYVEFASQILNELSLLPLAILIYDKAYTSLM